MHNGATVPPAIVQLLDTALSHSHYLPKYTKPLFLFTAVFDLREEGYWEHTAWQIEDLETLGWAPSKNEHECLQTLLIHIFPHKHGTLLVSVL